MSISIYVSIHRNCKVGHDTFKDLPPAKSSTETGVFVTWCTVAKATGNGHVNNDSMGDFDVLRRGSRQHMCLTA